MFLDWEPAQQKDYDDLLAAVRSRLGGANAAGPAGAFTRDDWRTCADLALLGLCVPVEYGGGGHGALDTAHLVEAFGRGCPNTGLVFAAGAHLFACAVPVNIGVVTLVMLSELEAPESLAAARIGVAGAAGGGGVADTESHAPSRSTLPSVWPLLLAVLVKVMRSDCPADAAA
jgi:alkylation response protein AidB-like acyl-CoA dehydrogenase